MIVILTVCVFILAFVGHFAINNSFVFPVIFILVILTLRTISIMRDSRARKLNQDYENFLRHFLKSVFDLDYDECVVTDYTRVSDFSLKSITITNSADFCTPLQLLLQESDKKALAKINSMYGLNLYTTQIKLIDIYKMIGAKNEKR